jgi:hypothetical protein
MMKLMLPCLFKSKTLNSVHSIVVSVWNTVIYTIVKISKTVSFLCNTDPSKIGTIKRIVRGIDLSKKNDKSRAAPT